MKKLLLSALAVVLFSASTVANAAVITYTFDGSIDGQTTYSDTQGGVTLTISDLSPTAAIVADSDGICLAGASGFCDDLNSLNISFSSAVQLVSYQVGFLSTGNEALNLLFTQGANQSLETNFVDEAITSFSNQFIALAGQAISVNASNFGGVGSLQFRQLTIDTSVAVDPEPVPVPATIALFFLALAGVFGSKRFS
jgi:hypothetical protein